MAKKGTNAKVSTNRRLNFLKTPIIRVSLVIIVLLIIAGIILVVSYLNSSQDNSYVATVNGEPISEKEFLRHSRSAICDEH